VLVRARDYTYHHAARQDQHNRPADRVMCVCGMSSTPLSSAAAESAALTLGSASETKVAGRIPGDACTYIYIYIEDARLEQSLGAASVYTRRARRWHVPRAQQPRLASSWPLHDIAITNIVWCMAYNGGIGGGGVYCAMVVP